VDYDFFISHASEDKDEVARPLASELVRQGFNVWYDELTLNVGDSLSRSIDAGLSTSKFGVVILSHSFFHRGWTNRELGALLTRNADDNSVILPVWHGVRKNDVAAYSPLLADIFATRWDTGLLQVVDDLIGSSGLASRSLLAETEIPASTRYRSAVKEIFGPVQYCSIGDPDGYRTFDYDLVTISSNPDDGDDVSAYFDIILSYGLPVSELSESTWDAIERSIRDTPEQFGLIVTERPLGSWLESYLEGTEKRAGFKVLRESPFSGVGDVPVFFVDVSKDDTHLETDLNAVKNLMLKMISSGILKFNLSESTRKVREHLAKLRDT
jgi:hypothetical protein